MKTIKLITENSYLKGYDEKGDLCCHLPLNNAPLLEGVPLLPSLEFDDDVEKLAEKNCYDRHETYNSEYTHAYIEGYNKAKEKYKYTEEDIDKAIEMAKEKHDYLYGYYWNKEQIIQSLSQPKNMPVAFERETGKKLVLNLGTDPFNPNSHVYNDEPKTTTNSQGQTQWVGKYIYA